MKKTLIAMAVVLLAGVAYATVSSSALAQAVTTTGSATNTMSGENVAQPLRGSNNSWRTELNAPKYDSDANPNRALSTS